MKSNAPVAIAILFIIIGASVASYLYLNGAFSTYSAGVTSCTDYTDVLSNNPSHSCSTLQVLTLQNPLQNVVANGATLYDANPNSPTYGKSSLLTKDARITLSAGNANPSSISGSFTCSALVDGKLAVTSPTNTTTFSSVPSGSKVCSVSIDGKTLQTQYFSPTVSSHVVSMAFSGKVNYVYPTGAVQSRSFSGSLGNITITITAPPATATTSSSSSYSSSSTSTSSSITVINDKIPISGGTGGVVTSSSSPVTPPTATIGTSDYSKQATQLILNSPSNVKIDTTQDPNYAALANLGTTSTTACQIGSCAYTPSANGVPTTTATVTKDDIAVAARDEAAVLKMFGATNANQLTPYTRAAYGY